MMTQLIGSDALSMTLVVTIFLLCLGIGSEAARFLVARSRVTALKCYVIIELLVALYGIFSVPLIRTINAAVLQADSLTADFLLNLALLAFPVIGMGITTPIAVHVAKKSLSNMGRTAGTLYGWNIAGAAVGSIVTGLVLIEAVGLKGTTYFAAAANVAAGGIAACALRLVVSGPQSAPPPLLPVSKPAMAAAVLFGFGTLALQVLFFRILSNYMTLSTIVFPSLLCAYLVLMSVGQWAGGKMADRYSDRLPEVIAGLFAAGAALLLAALRFPPGLAAKVHALRFSSFNGQLVAPEHHGLIGDPSLLTVFLFSAGLMLSVAAWSGLFPVMFRLITRRIEDAGARFARLYTLYTMGNVVGAFACGAFMLSLLGTGGSAMATVGVTSVAALMVVLSSGGSRRALATIIGGGVIALAGMPLDYYKRFTFDNYRVADVFEGQTGVVTVVPTTRFYTIIDVNRTASASALKTDPGPDDQYEAWRWNHTELMALDPAFRPRNVLVIGLGHAYLIDAMLDLPFIRKITIVEISEEVVLAIKKYTTSSTRRIFSDPRVNIVISDGRRFVQSALKNGERYDLIQNKINEPWHAGGGNLFTEEFFLEEKRLLAPGGYLSTRPLTGHLNDGLKVFGNVLWGGYYHMYFKNGMAAVPDQAVITRDIAGAWASFLPGRGASSTPREPVIRAALFTSVPRELKTDANTDDRPTFEVYWLRRLLGVWASPRVNLWDLDLRQYVKAVPVVIAEADNH
ncbi:MAG: hypothetical protein LBD42_05220 [Desulfovibrio sp.]|nr:hypothetical protein [Desulfovibrio sp.]